MKRKILFLLPVILALCLLPLWAMAEEYDIGNGSILVTADEQGQTVTQNDVAHRETTETCITGVSKANTLTVTAGEGACAYITLRDITIDASRAGVAAVTLTEGDAVFELDGSSRLTSAIHHAGLEKVGTGTLTFTDGSGTEGILLAYGGENGAGIGGGIRSAGTDICFLGGTVYAVGGKAAAGIGGGQMGDGLRILLRSGAVTALGGEKAAGIGGGNSGSGRSITVNGGTVTAAGGVFGAGIGGGYNGSGESIRIEQGAAYAYGGRCAAGIGGGMYGAGRDILITGIAPDDGSSPVGSVVIAAGGSSGAGIGGGMDKKGESITVSGAVIVSVSGGAANSNAGLGAGAAVGNGGRQGVTGAETDAFSSLCGGGEVRIYAPGTSVDAIQKGTVAPMTTRAGQGHSIVHADAKPSTCAVEGQIEHYRCQNCGKAFSDQEGTMALDSVAVPLDPKAHSWAEATCTEPRTCLLCGATEGKAQGHTWSEWGTVLAPSCTSTGTESRGCTVCGAVETRPIDALGHTPGDAVKENEIPATATENGSYDRVTYCTVCGEELSRKTEIIRSTGGAGQRPNPTPAQTPQPAETPAGEPEITPEPSGEPEITPEPSTEPDPSSPQEPESSPAPAVEPEPPADEPTEPVTDPIDEPATEPASEPATEPADEPAPEPPAPETGSGADAADGA